MKKKVIIICIVLLCILILGVIGFLLYRNYMKNNLVSFKQSNINSEVYSVITNKKVKHFNDEYQDEVDKKINKVMNKSYSFESPFMIFNPYDTNTTALNIYFSEKGDLNYTISVSNDNIPNYTNKLKQYKIGKNYGSSIIGLVAGYENNIKLTLTTDDGKTLEKNILVDLTNVKYEGEVATVLDIEEGESINELEDGLYAVFGHDKNYNADIYLYDNNGILRSELNLEDYRADRIIFTDDNSIIYSSKEDELIKVNALGKIKEKYDLDNYAMHHDYVYDNNNNNLIILASEKNSDTIEDMVISLDLNTKKVTEIVDMKDLLPEMYEKAFHPEKNSYGGNELDWVHLNSVDLIDDDSIVVSSRELSSVIKISNIFDEPTIDYILSDPSMYEDTTYIDLLYNKEGGFTSNAGQHSVVYEEDKTLNDGEYYLYMYNNNYGSSPTLPDFKFENYPNVGNYEDGEASYYYKYLVDENNNTYKLVDSIDVDYSSIVSSSQEYKNNIITSSGLSHLYAEYDKNGILIRKFKYTSKKFAYRVFKYDFVDFWFNSWKKYKYII